MTIKKKIILGLAVVLIAIQFFQPLRNQAVEVPATHIERVCTPKCKGYPCSVLL
jgi:hypothetical protein